PDGDLRRGHHAVHGRVQHAVFVGPDVPALRAGDLADPALPQAAGPGGRGPRAGGHGRGVIFVLGRGLLTTPRAPTAGLPASAKGRPAVGAVARSGDRATTALWGSDDDADGVPGGCRPRRPGAADTPRRRVPGPGRPDRLRQAGGAAD